MIPSEPPYFVTNPTCRPQFTIRALFVLVLAVACLFGGVRFERERRTRADEAAAPEFTLGREARQAKSAKRSTGPTGR
jgi:hypothetical protein